MFKYLKVTSILVLVILLLLISFSCGTEEKTSYNGRVYDLSEKGDNSITAKTVKEGTKYTLTISGSGVGVDFKRKEEVPWNPIIKSIDKVVIDNDVTKIGSFYFYSSVVDEFILSSSLKTISDNAFNQNQIIYSYSNDLTVTGEYKLYYYSETPPSEYGKYFHLVDEKPVIWNKYKVLFVGNSFTYYASTTDDPMVPKYFKNIATSLGENVEVDFVVKGSHTLTGYSNPNDEMGKILYEKLNSNNDYTHVILQEQSTAPINSYNNFKTAVGVINDLVKTTQKDCKVVLYETWGSPTGISSTGHKSVGEMEKALRTAYENCAKEYNLDVSYVGKAFTYAYEVKGINVYYDDNRHQNEVGAYLSSAVHVATILKADVRNTSFLGSLSEDQATVIREIAFNIAFNNSMDEVINNNSDNEQHLLVIAWYAKTQTSGLDDNIIKGFEDSLKDFLKTLNYSDEEVNSVLLRSYNGTVAVSCEAIKNDGDVSIMVGWKSNVDTNGNLSFIESFPSNTEESGITMGSVEGRWIHRLTNDELTIEVFNWIIREKDNLFK